MLQVSGNPTEAEKRALEAGWKRLLRGTGSAVRRAWGTIAVTEKVKPLVVGAPIRDLGMPTLKELVRREVCAALGVPVTLLEDSSNYASAESDRKSFYSETAIPEAELIAEAINEQLLFPLGMKLVFTPEQHEVMQQDEVKRAGALVTLRNAGVPLLQAMKILGYDMDDTTEAELRAFTERRDQEYEEARNRAAALRQMQGDRAQAEQPYQQAADPRNLIRSQLPPLEMALGNNGLGGRYEPG